MTTMGDRFEVNREEVAAKVIDGETVLINFSTGTYFSMDHAGTTIWELLERGYSLEQVARAVSGQYDVDSDRAGSDVSRLAAELTDARLIVPSDRPAPALGDPPVAGLPYEAPRLNSYGDMSDLLLLDPPMPGILDTAWTDPKHSPGTTGE
jgi:hypothetical protein